MNDGQDKQFPLITFSVFLIAFGWMLTVIFEDQIQAVILPLALEEEPEEESEQKEAEEQNSPGQKLHAVDVRYNADISETAIKEMEKGRFLVETELPTGSARIQIFRQLQNRGGLIVVQDRKNAYYLLGSDGIRKPLDEADIEHEAYAFHRPRKIAVADLQLLSTEAGEPGDVPFLVMPKNFEAQIISEIERTLNRPITEYSRARLALNLTTGGHLRLTIHEVTDQERQSLAINRSVTGL